jgi:hypothetical protein
MTPKRTITWNGSDYYSEHLGANVHPRFEDELEITNHFFTAQGTESVNVSRASLTFQQWIELAEAILAERDLWQSRGGEIINGVRPMIAPSD